MRTYSQRSQKGDRVLVVARPGGAPSADPVVRATAEMVTPDLAAIAALDAYLADWQTFAARRATIDAERACAPRNADTGPDDGDTGEAWGAGE